MYTKEFNLKWILMAEKQPEAYKFVYFVHDFKHIAKIPMINSKHSVQHDRAFVWQFLSKMSSSKAFGFLQVWRGLSQEVTCCLSGVQPLSYTSCKSLTYCCWKFIIVILLSQTPKFSRTKSNLTLEEDCITSFEISNKICNQ